VDFYEEHAGVEAGLIFCAQKVDMLVGWWGEEDGERKTWVYHCRVGIEPPGDVSQFRGIEKRGGQDGRRDLGC
jgi:hypothetical protein